MIQLDLLDLLATPAPAPIAYVRPERRQVQTRAAQHGGVITVYSEEWPDPFEVEVRGVPCVISFSGGFCTHAIEPAGSLFWSETGFRAFGGCTDDPDEIAAAVGCYIDGKKGMAGMGGQLVRWWPGYVLQWRQSLAFELSFKSRDEVWAQWGPEKHAETWRNHDARLADAVARMGADGIDPNDVGKPEGHRGRWPRIPLPDLAA